MANQKIQVGENELRRLQEERVVWFTTVRSDGTPQPTPVWFLWDQGTILIYSQPGTHKLRNLAQNPKVALNLNSDQWGGQVLVLTGEAKIDPHIPPADQVPSYLNKYRDGIADIQMTPESFAQSFSVPIRVTPTHIRSE